MGIRGLKTHFVEKYWLLEDYQLHDTRLVIDGDNLYYFLYSAFEINYLYGGDYMNFSLKVHDFFNTLQECKVSPYVIFDGCDEDHKVNTKLDRAKQRIVDVRLFNRPHRDSSPTKSNPESVLPILAHNTFRAVLNKRGIPHATCGMEADEEIAAIANAWDCPVLSNDSDFFVFPLRRGVVLLDFLKPYTQLSEPGAKPTTNQLKVQLFKQDILRRDYPWMNANHFALFATMFGNDYIKESVLQTFYSRLNIDSPEEKVGRLLSFFDEHRSFDEAFGEVIELGRMSDETRECIELCIRTYTRPSCKQLPCFYAALCVPEGVLANVAPATDCTGLELHTRKGTTPPEWFLRSVCSGEISALPLNAVVNRRVIFRAQLEDMSQTSAYVCSRGIRAFIYGILLSLYGDCSQPTSVDEYDRQTKTVTIQRVEVKARYSFPKGSPVPKLINIPSMSVEDRIGVYNQVMRLQSAPHPALSDIHFFMSVISYWVSCRQAKVKLVHLYAAWLCVLKLMVIDPGSVQKTAGSQEDPWGSYSDHDDGVMSLAALREVTEQPQFKVTAEKLKKFERDEASFVRIPAIVHAFAQLQAIYKDALDLNAILQHPHPIFPNNVALTFEGTFLYNISIKLNKPATRDPLKYIRELLGEVGHLADWFEKSIVHILKWVDPDGLLREADAVEQKERTRHKRGQKARGPSFASKTMFDILSLDDSDDSAESDWISR